MMARKLNNSLSFVCEKQVGLCGTRSKSMYSSTAYLVKVEVNTVTIELPMGCYSNSTHILDAVMRLALS